MVALHFTLICLHGELRGEDFPAMGERLTDQQVTQFANLVLAGLDREYPNKPSNVVTSDLSVQTPRQLHPAFFGCFDWHSSVHGHWMLIRLLKQYPDCSIGPEVRQRLAAHLTKDLMQAEAAYFDEKENKSFERMYGWAWLLRMVAELHTWEDKQGREWREHIRPLEEVIVALTEGYLPRLTYPIRTGVHPDTAFALAQILDYARAVKDQELEELIVQRAKFFYQADETYPVKYEPSGEDFFSAGLNEADLMRRVLDADTFSNWLDKFLPNLIQGSAKNLLTPVAVSDVTDGKLVHLAGLNLSRAWTLQGISQALPKDDARRELLQRSADDHARAGLSYVFSGHYEGEHWLATFSIYAIDQVALE
jgi:hypothetical protein